MLPLSWAVGLNKADDWGSRQGFCSKDTPLQLDPKTCERIPPQDDLSCFHMKNLAPWADRTGRQRYWGTGWEEADTSERDISGEVADKWSRRGIVSDKKWRRLKGRDVHPQRREGMSHLSEFVCHVYVTDQSNLFTRWGGELLNDCPLLDKVCNYTLLKYPSKHFLQPVLISNIYADTNKSVKCQYQPIISAKWSVGS